MGFVIGLLLIAALRGGPWGTKAIILRTCSQAGFTKEQMVLHLPLRLKNAPDILEFLDLQGFKQRMQARLNTVHSVIGGVLEKPFCVDKADVRKVALNPREKVGMPEFTNNDIRMLRIQSVQVVCKVVTEQFREYHLGTDEAGWRDYAAKCGSRC